jgi:hypothetical protein
MRETEGDSPPMSPLIDRDFRLGFWKIYVVAFAFLAGCANADPPPPAKSASVAQEDPAAWLLRGDSDERFARVAKHLRGFDVAMVETGYRYGELYWSGQDRNWDYAKYQLDKIRTAVANGVERRPKRGTSAQALDGALSGMDEAIGAKDPALFARQFEVLTATCNACHEAERGPFVVVRAPSARTSPVGPPAAVAATR